MLNGKNTRRKSYSATVLSRKGLAASGAKEEPAEGLSDKNEWFSPPVRRCILRCIIIGNSVGVMTQKNRERKSLCIDGLGVLGGGY